MTRDQPPLAAIYGEPPDNHSNHKLLFEDNYVQGDPHLSNKKFFWNF